MQRDAVNTVSPRRSPTYRRLLPIALSTLAALGLSREYLAAGSSEAFFAIAGAGALLALLTIVPAFLADRGSDSD